MKSLNKILVVLDRGDADATVLAKAVTLARQHNAVLELFLCDAEAAYSLSQAYDVSSVTKTRHLSVRRAQHYLESLRDAVTGADIRISVDAACESPLYEGIVRKVLKSRPDLVIKNAGGLNPLRRFACEPNDWQLIRACPATLLLSRGRSWGQHSKFAAAVDVSGAETSDLPQAILEISTVLSNGCHGEVDVVYSEPQDADARGHTTHLTALGSLMSAAGLSLDRVHVLSGNAEQALPPFAAAGNYDVLVLGALTHRKGLSSLVGTLTSRLVDTLDCDFVLVKPSTYQSQVEPLSPATGDETVAEDREPEDVLEPRVTAGNLGFLAPWQLPGR
jgi:universal stress protein E